VKEKGIVKKKVRRNKRYLESFGKVKISVIEEIRFIGKILLIGLSIM
jgi:hypothetical protein